MIVNQSNGKQRQSKKLRNELIQVLNTNDFTGKVSNEQRNLDRPKARINRFAGEHLDNVLSITDYFYNEIMTYGIKSTLTRLLERTDKVRMKKLLNRFFIEHENDVRFICNYFLNDLIPFFVENEYLTSALQSEGVGALLNCVSTEGGMMHLKYEGAKSTTASLMPGQDENQASTPTPSKTNFTPLIVYVLILFYLLGWSFLFTVFYSFVGLLLVIFAVFIQMRSQ